MQTDYKCLSLQQPHAWLAIIGLKKVENRSKPSKHRGRVFIHASKVKKHVKPFLEEHKGLHLKEEWLSLGAVIGHAELRDVVPINKELESDPFAAGPFCYLLENAFCFQQPVRCDGQVGIFNLPHDVKEQLDHQCTLPPRDWSFLRRSFDTLKPSPEDRQLGIVLSYWDNQEQGKALELLGEMIKRKKDAELYEMRSRMLAELDLFQDAMTDLNHAIAIDRSNPDLFAARGNLYQHLGYSREAIVNLSAAIDLDSERGEFFFYRAIAHVAEKENEKALSDFSRAIELDPQMAQPYSYRSFLYSKMRQPDKANADLARARKLLSL